MDKPRVRPLEWGHHPAGAIAAPPTGHTYIIDTRMRGRVYSIKGFNPQREFASMGEAKAAAQADYEARILAALEPMEIPKKTLKPFWQDKLNRRMEDVFPDVIGEGDFVQSWKQDGWNDGTTTLFGVYLCGGQYVMCAFPDYREPRSNVVNPRFEHTDWDIVGHKDAE